MLSIVPDEPDESLDLPENAAVTGSPKAVLDDSETTQSTKKVDLDLDDAPFLEEEEEEEEVLEEEEFQLPTEIDEPKEKKGLPAILKNKFVIIGAGSVIALALLAFFLLGGEDSPDPEVVEEAPQVEEVVEEPVVVEEEVIPEEPGEVLVKFDPFLVEQRDSEGTIRFLEISLVFSTPEQMLADNLTRETPTVRYALFYYLKSKDLAFLTDQTNVDSLKEELLSVTNQYMVAGQFETLLFEQFLVK